MSGVDRFVAALFSWAFLLGNNRLINYMLWPLAIGNLARIPQMWIVVFCHTQNAFSRGVPVTLYTRSPVERCHPVCGG